MNINFTKMHALGNDYIFINGFEYPNLIHQASEISKIWSDRHFSIGGDGVIFVLPSQKAHAMMRIFNLDGSEAEMCGNGIRQAAKFLYDKGIKQANPLMIETLAGIKEITVFAHDNKLTSATVKMGAPILKPETIPCKASLNSNGFYQINAEINGQGFLLTPVSMGNPHAVCFVDELQDYPVEKYGKILENSTDIFPKRSNIEFIKILNKNEISMRVWERGSGETLACGTGACASVVASILNGYTDSKVKVHLLGGDLQIEWNQEENQVYMTGDAKIAFEGNAELNL